MGLDTKYRPTRYADVLGQAQTITICREYVRRNVGFHQSYMFYGPFGTGKTTLGRILGRSLLCSSPRDGEGCGECASCEAFDRGTLESFVEFDAATNSGKEDIRRLLEDINYNTFSGSRRIYLIDESHELSRQAMDALLKPLEQTWPGTLEKQLVCIFCTTEPDKMRPAILSRCAPSFRIRVNTPEEIAGRMAMVCVQEGIQFEEDALRVIAEVKECHIRDCLKALESLQVLGGVTMENVRGYLHLGVHEVILDIVAGIGNTSAMISGLESLEKLISPSSAYQRLAEVCLLSYKVSKYGGVPVPSYLPRTRLEEIGKSKGEFLLWAAKRFAERPYRASYVMLGCDLLSLGVEPVAWSSSTPPEPKMEETSPPSEPVQESFTSSGGVFIDPAARRTNAPLLVQEVNEESSSMSVESFLQVFMKEYHRGNDPIQNENSRGRPGQHDVGGAGADSSGLESH